jgi:hypothetical protein
MRTVTVRSVARFEHAGRFYAPGAPVTVSPVEALILARRRLVTLDASAQPDEAEVIEPTVVEAPVRRRRGRPKASEYQTRALVAES